MSYTAEQRLHAAQWFFDIHDAEDPPPELLQEWLRWLDAAEGTARVRVSGSGHITTLRHSRRGMRRKDIAHRLTMEKSRLPPGWPHDSSGAQGEDGPCRLPRRVLSSWLARDFGHCAST